MVVKKRKGSQDIFIIVGLTTLTVFTWIGLDVYHSFKKSAVSKVLKEQIRALNPNFDEKTIEFLDLRLSVGESELDNLRQRRLKLVEKVESETASPAGDLALPETEIEGEELE